MGELPANATTEHSNKSEFAAAPAVSVIVTVHRRLQYLAEALASARGQTFGDFEVVVSDDGGLPETRTLVEGLGDPRVRYHRHLGPPGMASNHAAAFGQARGRYLAILNEDDVWEPGFLAALVPPLEADPSVMVAFCDHHLIDETGRLMPEKTDANSAFYGRDRLPPGRQQPFVEMAVVRETLPIAMASVFRRSIFDGGMDFPVRLGGTYDHWIAYLLSRDGQAAYYVPQRLTRYRVHAGSGTSTRTERNLRNCIIMRKRLLRDPRLRPFHRALANNLGVYYGKLALCLMARRRRREGYLIARRAFALLHRPKNMAGLAYNLLRAGASPQTRS